MYIIFLSFIYEYFISSYIHYFSSLLIQLEMYSFPSEENRKLRETTFYKTKWLLFWVRQNGGTPGTETRAKLIPNFYCVQNQDSAELTLKSKHYLFPFFGFKSGIYLLIPPVPVHCFSITLIEGSGKSMFESK